MKRLIRLLLIAILGLIFSLGIPNLFPVTAKQPVFTQPTVEPLTLVKTGKTFYDNGQFTAAVKTLHQAEKIYQVKGDFEKQAQVLSFISLAYQKLGNFQEAETAIKDSSLLLESLPKHKSINKVRAQVLNAQGHLQLAKGNATAALKSWKDGEKLYKKSGNQEGIIGSRINQVQALQTLGFYRQAYKLITDTEKEIQSQPDSNLKLTGLNSISNIFRQRGNLEGSQTLLKQSLVLVQKLELNNNKELSSEKSKILLSLGNTNLALAKQAKNIKDTKKYQKHLQQALNFYQQAGRVTNYATTKIQAELNQFSLLVDNKQLISDQDLLSSIFKNINQLPTSRTSVYALVNFAENLMKLKKISKATANLPNINQILNTAIEQANKLNDKRAKSYALGTLGKLDENNQKWSNAQKYTQSALLIAQSINAPDIAYQWQWQLGRILKNRNKNSEAINYFTQALDNLKILRSDLVALNPEVQFSFRESVEPIYRQLVDLLLTSPQPNKNNLIQARNVIEALQLAELDNFFRDACAKAVSINIENLDKNAAVIYPIILENRLEVILKLPGKDNLHHFTNQNIDNNQVDEAVKEMRKLLKRRSTSPGKIKQASKQLYNWLIKPFEAELEKVADRNNSQIKTLVFVLDGSLQNIPISLLHDGNNYLIERYAVAVTPGLQLLSPKPLLRKQVNALIAGATNAPSFEKEGLNQLENVQLELSEISEQVNRDSKLENQDFLQQNIQKQINSTSFNIVHIATHGKFSSNPEQTYILDWDKRIQIKDWDNLLQIKDLKKEAQIELLVLSACETATGDKRAALGLAGVAIRAGARSTLATLWQVNDASTAEFMIQFYKQLNNPNITKAEAVRNAQLAFLKDYPDTDYNRPYHWAPFILVGNWL
ncbi:MAG: CHAT domain-containing protein [Cyanobacteria bacterium P01_D01_bin.116]